STQRMVTGTRPRAHLISAALAVDQESARRARRHAALATRASQGVRILSHALTHDVDLFLRHARSQVAKQRDGLMRIDHDAQVTAEAAPREARDVGAVLLKMIEGLVDQIVDARSEGGTGIDVARRAERFTHRIEREASRRARLVALGFTAHRI